MIYKKKKKLWKTDIIKTITKEYFTNSLCFSQFDSFIAVKSRITRTYGIAAGGTVVWIDPTIKLKRIFKKNARPIWYKK